MFKVSNIWKIIIKLRSKWLFLIFSISSRKVTSGKSVTEQLCTKKNIRRLYLMILDIRHVVFGLKGSVVNIRINIYWIEDVAYELSCLEPGIFWSWKFFFRPRLSIFRDSRCIWRIKIIPLCPASQQTLLPFGKTKPDFFILLSIFGVGT